MKVTKVMKAAVMRERREQYFDIHWLFVLATEGSRFEVVKERWLSVLATSRFEEVKGDDMS